MVSLERTEERAKDSDADQGSPENLYKTFSSIRSGGLARTQLDPSRMESFFPKDLRSAYTLATARNGEKSFQDTPTNRQMVIYLEKDIFGKLPDYKAPIDPSHCEGFKIDGVLRTIFMDRNVAKKAVERALTGLTPAEVVKRVMSDYVHELKIQLNFPKTDISRATHGNFGSGANRHLVANIIKTAEAMKSNAPKNPEPS